jgi:signal transduction histidine kinase
LVVALAVLAPLTSVSAQSLPRAVLVLDQSDADSAWFEAFSSAFRASLNARSATQISVYSEHIDLNRFSGLRHDDVVRTFLRDKFSERPIGVIVAQGSGALDFLTRAPLWPNTPVVMAAVDDATVARLRLPPNVTGTTYRLTFRDAVASAKMLVPNLKRIALVGDPFERQAVRGHFKEEIPAAAAGLEVIDLLGLPMTDLLNRVAVLPEDTAIIYTAINTDGAGVVYHPHEALKAVSQAANRPIVIDAETSVGYGGTGGLIVSPRLVGADTADLVLRVLGGQKPSEIPIAKGGFARPIFDWRELQRFGVDERRLPEDSQIRFRPPTLWDQYRWQVVAVTAILLTQALMISGLLIERRRRHLAEADARRRLLELMHLNRTAITSALSGAVAHELNQPLGAIQSYAEAATLYLKADPPNILRVEQILEHIRQDDKRAADIISQLRALLKKSETIELQEFDLNEVVRDTLQIAGPQAMKQGVELSGLPTNGRLPVQGNRIQLQQAILNLVMNGIDAIQNGASGPGRITVQTTTVGDLQTEVSVTDSGTGIPADKLKKVFDAFYTTKRNGTGLGLSIARTIVETYGGTIWAENRAGGGAVFRFTLPLSKASAI